MDLRSIKAGVELTRTPIKMDMLFGLTQLTMRMCDLKYLKGDEYTHARLGNHPFWLYRMLTPACLMLSSASRLKTLTITNAPLEGVAWDANLLARLLFPVVLLNRTAAIRVGGGSPALHTALDASRRQVHSRRERYPLSNCGSVISRAIDMLERSRRKVDAGTFRCLPWRLTESSRVRAVLARGISEARWQEFRRWKTSLVRSRRNSLL